MNVLILLVAVAQPGAGTAGPPAEFGWFRELAGACWQGDHPGSIMRDRQCYSAQFGRFMRGTIRITRPRDGQSAPAHHGDSVFAWDAGRQRLIFYFWGSDGQHGVSEGYYEGDALIFEQPPTSGGQPVGRRTIWRRVDADHFRVTVQMRSHAIWTDRFTVTYERSGAGD
ncbi:MAG TPA: hypothetical protein VEC11_09680 [Allosphingosinicella sp.]|nr:hypothetical protein [Allosphingosinicella sp.]